eukprot:1839532-Amphidinium_carterae.1
MSMDPVAWKSALAPPTLRLWTTVLSGGTPQFAALLFSKFCTAVRPSTVPELHLIKGKWLSLRPSRRNGKNWNTAATALSTHKSSPSP